MIIDQEVAAQIRLECLKLAVDEDAMAAGDTLQRARTYAQFVLGEGSWQTLEAGLPAKASLNV